MGTLGIPWLLCLLLFPSLAEAAPAHAFAVTEDSSWKGPKEPCAADPRSYFSDEERRAWNEYQQQQRAFHLVATGSVFVFFSLFFSLGLNRRLKNIAEQGTRWVYSRGRLIRLGKRWPILGSLAKIPERLFGERQWLVVLLYGLGFVLLFRIVFFPYTFYWSYWFERQSGLSNYTLGLWFLDYGKSLLLGTVLYAFMIFGIYGLLARVGRRWWLLLWVGVSLAIFAWVYVVPYSRMVYNDFHPLEKGELRGRLEHLARDQGLQLDDIFVVDASRRTKKVNAYVTGEGNSRRIVLFDTLIESFTPREITLIMAHEIAHWKEPGKNLQYLLFSLTVLGLLFLADRVLQWGGHFRLFGYTSPRDVSSLPLLLLTFFLMFMILRPFNLYIKRTHELETDRMSLRMVCDPEAFVQAHVKLARLNHSEIDPKPLVVFLFYSHPPFLKRIEVALCENCQTESAPEKEDQAHFPGDGWNAGGG
jgi:STE24 endopeptidase